MLLRDLVDSTPGLTFRALADRVECSHNHLVQVANLQKNVGSALGARIKRYDPRFSIEDQVEAFQRAEQARRSGGERTPAQASAP